MISCNYDIRPLFFFIEKISAVIPKTLLYPCPHSRVFWLAEDQIPPHVNESPHPPPLYIYLYILKRLVVRLILLWLYSFLVLQQRNVEDYRHHIKLSLSYFLFLAQIWSTQQVISTYPFFFWCFSWTFTRIKTVIFMFVDVFVVFVNLGIRVFIVL